VNTNDDPYNLYERPFYQECLDKISDNFGDDYFMDISFGLILNLGWEIQGGVYVDDGNMVLMLRLLRKIVRERNIALKVDNDHYLYMILS
jgi:hypothetical protein